MKGVSTVGHKESGSCPIGPSSLDPPLAIASGSDTVFIDDIPAARSGDPYSGVHVHKPNPNQKHPVFCGPGSDFVFFDDLPAFKIGDLTTCPSTQEEGSDFVFIEE